ncbi:MAG: MFS transporter [archaeon]|jgi:MFS family permease
MDVQKHLHILKNKEIDELYINIGLRSFALALVSVFIPIFLLDLGFNLIDIFMVYLLLSVFHILFTFVSSYLSSKVGFKHTMILSQPFLIAFFIILFSLDAYHLPLILLSLSYGIFSGLFWPAFHGDFAKFSDIGSKGSQVAFGNIIASLLSIMAPIIGGVIVAFFSFQYVFLFAIALLIVSVIPLFLTKDNKEPVSFSIKNIFKYKSLKHTFGYLGYGFSARGFGVVWPIFLFVSILNESYIELGLLTAFLFFFSFISTIIIGKKFDKHNKNFIEAILGFSGFIWLFKLFVVFPIFAYLADLLHGLTKPAHEITVDGVTYENAMPNIVDYIIYRELFIHLGIILYLAVLIFVPSLMLGLFLASIGSFMMILLQK